MAPTRPCARSCHVLLFFLALVILSPAAALAENPCRDCHAEVFTPLEQGPHRAVAERGAQFCVSCHGDAAAHLASPEAANIVTGPAAAALTSEKQAAACASCHAREFPGWRQSAHAGEGLCWSCHASQALHWKPEETAIAKISARESFEGCTSCHREVAAQFRMHYRHPAENGQVTCTTCHDIHGRTPHAQQLVADATCLSCHEEQNGPFLFVHGAMENGCASCHAPHGSAHRGQLRTAGNGACLSCHVQTNFPTVGAASHDFRLSGGGRCWDCHSEVHGSNTTPDLNPRGRR
jgi:DmsE family decaheme c-type cytochrome